MRDPTKGDSMENEETADEVVIESTLGQQFGKAILGASAAFLATKLVEKVVDGVIAARRNRA